LYFLFINVYKNIGLEKNSNRLDGIIQLIQLYVLAERTIRNALVFRF